ncbi:MAG: S24/S26 family peptidase [Armatimonadota bacterium]
MDADRPERTAEDLWVEGLRRQGRARLAVRGDSMAPALHDGQEVEVDSVSPSDLGVGEVAVIRTAGGLLTHRVVGRGRHRGAPVLLLKGDAAAEVTVAEAADVVGRVCGVEGWAWRRQHRAMLALCRAFAALLPVAMPLRQRPPGHPLRRLLSRARRAAGWLASRVG